MPVSPKKLYDVLLGHFGHLHWWPVDTQYHKKQGSDPRFEIMVGAILTQNTAWSNVEKALANLKQQRLLSLSGIVDAEDSFLKTLIQPSGFFNQKAQRLKNLSFYLRENYNDDLDLFFHRDATKVRTELLSLSGIGFETADSMLLYAGNHPIFVVDAYTKRVSTRIPFSLFENTYEVIQQFFEEKFTETFPQDKLVSVYQDVHALIVELAKQYCTKKNPTCPKCPLRTYCGSSSVF